MSATAGSGIFAIEEHNDNTMNFSAALVFSTSASLIDKRGNDYGIKKHYTDSRVIGENGYYETF